MIDIVLRQMAVVMVFASMAACAWLNGGTRVDAVVPTLPWVLVFLFEGMLFFPQRRPGEIAMEARKRVWHDISRDPLTYFILIFIVLLCIPFVNTGLCPSCDYPEILRRCAINGLTPEETAKPPVPFAPFCVNIKEQFEIVLWFLPALVGCLAAKHSLRRSGKRMLMEMVVWNAALLSVFGFIEQGFEAKAPFWADDVKNKINFFSTFGYSNMAGGFFVTAFGFAIAVWQNRVPEVAAHPHIDKTKSLKEQMIHRWLLAHYALIPAILIFFGVLCTLCRAAMSMLFVLAGSAFVYYILSLLFSRNDRVRRIRHSAIAIGGGLFFLLLVSVFAPPEMSKELDSVNSVEMLDRISGKGQYHNKLAVRMIKDHPAFGVGGWGYKHFTLSYIEKDELKQLQKFGGANVHNDYVQFVCEHGIVGGILLLSIFMMLVWPIFRDWFVLYKAARFMRPDKAPPRPRAIFCLPAGTFWILAGNTCLVIHACGDCPMRSAAVLSMLFVSLACATGYIPREVDEN